MKLHSKAWEDISIVVLGKTSLYSMEIEQAIAEANPSLEVNTESFEEYSDALDYCKQKMNVGVIFFEDVDNPDYLLQDYFKNLSSYFKKSGWPCIGRVIYKDKLSQKSTDDIINLGSPVKHVSHDIFQNISSCQSYLDLTWDSFYANLKSQVLPSAIEDTINTILKFQKKEEDIFFLEGISRKITEELNINWFDRLAIDINYKINTLKSDDAIIMANKYLKEISSLTQVVNSSNDPIQIMNSKLSLVQKVPSIVYLLNEKRKDGLITEFLEEISSTRSFRSSAIHKVLANKKDNILESIENVYSLKKRVA